MTDYFALMGQARRPWLDPEALREKFISLSATTHPDRMRDGGEPVLRAAQDRSAELNAAYQCLREPRDRLRHLLALERGTAPAELQLVEPELMDMFAGLNRVLRQADGVLGEKAPLASPLLQAQWYGRAQACQEELAAEGRRLADRLEQLDTGLKRSGEAWDRATTEERRAILDRLEFVYRSYGFLNRWSSQVRERLVRFACEGLGQ
jgi:curved DNA-binding protein CbpA